MNELRTQLYCDCSHYYYFLLFDLHEFFVLCFSYLAICFFQFRFSQPMVHYLVRKMIFFFLLKYFFIIFLHISHCLLAYFKMNQFLIQYLFKLNN